MNQELKSRFSFHTPDSDGINKMEAIRVSVRQLAEIIDQLCPDGREKSTAFTQLQFVMMSANSAIVQQYPIKE
jgi:hypothetical protein